jgi:hypothetical protein
MPKNSRQDGGTHSTLAAEMETFPSFPCSQPPDVKFEISSEAAGAEENRQCEGESAAEMICLTLFNAV